VRMNGAVLQSDFPAPVRCWPAASGTEPADAARSIQDHAHALFTRHGEMPHQNPTVLAARLSHAAGRDHAVYLWPADQPRCLLALQRVDDVWRSVFPGAPILTEGTIDGGSLALLFAHVAKDLSAEALYFPLAYRGTVAARALESTPAMACWPRSPSPVVDWKDRGDDVLARFRERHGSQADRKLRRWRQHLAVTTTLDPRPAEDVLARVEQRSWKAGARLDLESAGQLDYYRCLLNVGAATLTAAFQGNEPVAYRIDLRHERAVYAVEWSFVREAAPSAPGMFLLTVGLVERWAGDDLDFIDLFGAPDLLKTMVETRRRDRMDFAWPAGSVVDGLRAERQAHDVRLDRQLADGVGIRRTYAPPRGIAP
jgi:hypothetical protein